MASELGIEILKYASLAGYPSLLASETLLRIVTTASMVAFVLALLALSAPAAALAPGSTVTVIGASGNVGKLVALRLSETFKVRGVVRSAARARSFLPDSVDLFECDLRDGPTASLAKALDGAAGLVVCTGTTAFPTKAWSESGRDDVTFPVLQALFEAKGDRFQAIDLLTERGYNTPATVDETCTKTLIDAWFSAAGQTETASCCSRASAS